MNFYFNYFFVIGREQSNCQRHLSSFLLLKMLSFAFPPPCSAMIKRTYHCSRFVRRSTMHYRLENKVGE